VDNYQFKFLFSSEVWACHTLCMTKLIYFLAIASLSVLPACASKKTTPRNPGAVVKTPKVLELERKQKEHEEALQDLKDRNQVLSKKAQMNPNSVAAKSSNNNMGVLLQARPQNKRIEMSAPNVDNKSLSEKDLYAEVLGSYERNNMIAFASRFQAFQQRFAKSSLMDDAIHLAGLMALSNRDYGQALKHFNQVLKKYPLSNKASASMYAKGITLKKMNLTDESRQVFAKVRQAYPGGPEALRAETELKLLKR
jgi:TolA-binding protein